MKIKLLSNSVNRVISLTCPVIPFLLVTPDRWLSLLFTAACTIPHHLQLSLFIYTARENINPSQPPLFELWLLEKTT